jgi:non-canonical (house-cleaning) NTP pyrophosphatase
MTIGFYSSGHYLDLKKQAVEEASQRIKFEANIIVKELTSAQTSSAQVFGFEELFRKAGAHAAEAQRDLDVDIGIGIENALAYIYNSKEWYYVICIAVHLRDGTTTATFAPGIIVPAWIIKEVQEQNIRFDTFMQRLTGDDDDPIAYFSSKALSRKDLLISAIIIAFSKVVGDTIPRKKI